jgi:hypothetical protein
MVDAVLFGGTIDDPWRLDVNITRGQLQPLNRPTEKNTANQRKAVLAYQIMGSIPGDWDRGIDWAKIISTAGTMPLADAMMQVQSALQEDTGPSAQQSFTVPIIRPGDDSVNIQLLTVSPDDIKEFQNG